jgi:hypothetical protein
VIDPGDPGDEDDGRGIPEWKRVLCRGLGVPEDTDDPVWEATSDAEKARLHALGYSREIEMKHHDERTRAERLQVSAFHLRVAIGRAADELRCDRTRGGHDCTCYLSTAYGRHRLLTTLSIKFARQRAWLDILEAKIWIASQPADQRPILGEHFRRNYAALTRETR